MFGATSWHSKALCAKVPDPNIFFRARDFDVAKAVCATCPVRELCRVAGWRERTGVWGGTTPADRGFPPRAEDEDEEDA